MTTVQIGLTLMFLSAFAAGTAFFFMPDRNAEWCAVQCILMILYYAGSLPLAPAVMYGTAMPLYIGYAAATVIAGCALTALSFYAWMFLLYIHMRVTKPKPFGH